MKTHLSIVICAVLAAACQAKPQGVKVSADGRHFAFASSNQPYVPVGFNYDRDYKMRLIEEYWANEWQTVESDFREMKELGANVVRVHLQFGKFMDAPDRPNRENLERLGRLVKFAESLDLHLDLTGLACYHKQNIPRWFDEMNEQDRWQAQANFWAAIARTCADRPGVFCYDLINEPVVPDKKVDDWLVPVPLAGFYYVQYLTRDPAGRDRMDIAKQWTAQMVAAIRKYDRQHMITIGILPNTPDIGSAVAPQLDFLATHIYPETGKVDDAIKTAKSFEHGKPIVIEEMFPLNVKLDEMADFIARSRPIAAGWISFYWGQTVEDLKKSGTMADAMMLKYLEFWQQQFAPQKLSTPATR